MFIYCVHDIYVFVFATLSDFTIEAINRFSLVFYNIRIIGAGSIVWFLQMFSTAEETREGHATDPMIGHLPTGEYLPHCHPI